MSTELLSGWYSFAMSACWPLSCFFFTDPAATPVYTLSLHDALPISAVELGLLPVTVPWPRSDPLVVVSSAASSTVLISVADTSDMPSLMHLIGLLVLSTSTSVIV